MPVVSVKVDERMKKEMERYRKQIVWPDEIRNFIGGKIEQVQREVSLKEVERMLSGVPSVPKGTAARLVREDRDSGH
jgi:hypothetical protein